MTDNGGLHRPRIAPSDNLLIEMWHGPLTSVEIGLIVGVNPKAIHNHWYRLRRLGRIPAHSRKDDNLHRTAVIARTRGNKEAAERDLEQLAAFYAGDDDDKDSVAYDARSGAPSVLDIYDNDPLLRRLYEVHGEPRPDLFPGLPQ